VAKMAKRRNLIHYVFFIFVFVLYMWGMRWAILNIAKLPIKTDNYFSETDKIKEGLNLLVAVGCKNTTDWYCGKNYFEVKEIEATRDNSFSTGVGRSEKGEEFWWVAVKNESWWNDMILLKDGEKVKCEEIPDELKPKMFGEKLRYCEDKQGKTVDRAKLSLEN
jgi:nitrogen fixation protein